jgi:broad specificity phosphatase PhoE
MIFVRHGQSEFNVAFGLTRQDPGIEDPSITVIGAQQIASSRDFLADHAISTLVVSPYRRTLQSARILREALRVKVEIEPLVREHKHFSCDIGTPASQLNHQWPDFRFHDIDEQWWPEAHETDDLVRQRGLAFLAKYHNRDDWDQIAVVSHWGFIRGVCGLEVGNGTVVRIDRNSVGKVVHTCDPC